MNPPNLVLHFHLEHLIRAPVATVEAILLRPATLQALAQRSPIGYRAELVSLGEVGDLVDRVARFDARDLRSVAGPGLPTDRAIWTERLIWRRRDHAATFIVLPVLTSLPQRSFACHGEYLLFPEGGQTTRRVVDGQVSVEVPVVGPELERAINRLLRIHFDAEAHVLEDLGRAPARVAHPPGRR
jgi:hypothetical protein